MAVNKDFIYHVIEVILNKKSEYTTTYQPKKKFSELAEYVRDGKLLGHSLAGRATNDSDNGYVFTYDYLMNGKDSMGGSYSVVIRHMGEYIESCEVKSYTAGAAYIAKKAIQTMEETIKDCVVKAEPKKEEPKADYSGKSMDELVDMMDKKLQAFGADVSIKNLNSFVEVKEALEAKINALPLAERSPFSKPLGDINMFVNTIKTQLSNPMLDAKQFAGTYVMQMSAALADIATALNK